MRPVFVEKASAFGGCAAPPADRGHAPRWVARSLHRADWHHVGALTASLDLASGTALTARSFRARLVADDTNGRGTAALAASAVLSLPACESVAPHMFERHWRAGAAGPVGARPLANDGLPRLYARAPISSLCRRLKLIAMPAERSGSDSESPLRVKTQAVCCRVAHARPPYRFQNSDVLDSSLRTCQVNGMK